jgi:hypothetical protein
MVLKLIRINKKKIYILGVIKGLTIERVNVKKAFNKLKPDVIALYISDHELLGLQSVSKGSIKEVPLSRYEVIYARKLAQYAKQDPDKYGDVQVPPPALMEGLELGLEKKLPVVALDMDDTSFANVFTRNVSTFQLIRHSTRFKRLSKKNFKVNTPEEFTFAWDNELNKLKGFRNLENARETHMAERLFQLTEKFNCILAIIEVERSQGVFNKIKNIG